jgi:hypothetical protein
VIDPIDDDPDGACDFEEPGPSWAECPMLPRSDMLAVIERHKALDRRAVNLFRNALKGQPRSDLFEYYLGPNLYHPLHLHDTRPRPVPIHELATRDHGIGDRTSVDHALCSVFEHPVVDR